MVLMAATEVEDWVRDTSTDYTSLIADYIPLVAEDVCTYLDNWFEDPVVFVDKAGGLKFNRGDTDSSDTSADTIVDDNNDMSTAGFAPGMDVAVRGGSNGGIYELAAVSTSTLTMTSTGVFVTQDQDASYNSVGWVKISRIHWPDAIKPIVAKMIWYQIEKSKPDGAISERVDDYSVAFAGARAYPVQLLDQLRNWKQVSMR